MPDESLADLLKSIPFPHTILEEIFSHPFPVATPLPQSIAELASQVALPTSDVTDRLMHIIQLSSNLFIENHSSSDVCLLVDPAPPTEFVAQLPPGYIRLLDISLIEQLPKWQKPKRVIAISSLASQAASAALRLRQLGIDAFAYTATTDS